MRQSATRPPSGAVLAAPIDRRTFLARLAAGAVLLPAACSQPRPVTRPNLLLIMTDDQSWDSIGYASDGHVHTPNLDRLARQGMIFERGHCSSMPCIASRSSMMSGLHHHRWRHGGIPNGGLRQGEWTWAHALRTAGYHTALVGKMHFSPRHGQQGFDVMELCDPWPGPLPGRPLDDWEQWLQREKVFDAWVENLPLGTDVRTWALPIRYHRISWVTDRAIELLDAQRGGSTPSAMVVSYLAPHPTYDPAEPFASMYDPERVALPDEHWLDMRAMPGSLRAMSRPFERRPASERAIATVVAAVRALVSQVDDAVGRLLEHVDLSTTLVVFVSDHGDYLGRRGQMWKAPTIPFEALARIPFFAVGSGVPAGTRHAAPVSLVDLAPTFLEAAGIPVPADLDGRPLQECFRAPTSGEGRTIYCFGAGGFDMVQRGDVKYFRAHQGSDEMLFDLSSDPGELVNLAGEEGRRNDLEALRREMDLVLNRPRTKLPRFPVQHDDSRERS